MTSRGEPAADKPLRKLNKQKILSKYSSRQVRGGEATKGAKRLPSRRGHRVIQKQVKDTVITYAEKSFKIVKRKKIL